MTKLDISSVANASLPAVPYTWKHTYEKTYKYKAAERLPKKNPSTKGLLILETHGLET